MLVITAPSAILKWHYSAASLIRDSPSRISINPFGNFIPWVIAFTATASVRRQDSC